MSEIRTTTTIEEINVPPREPLISLNEVITGIGWVAFQGARLAVKGVVGSTVLAYKGGKALAAVASESRRRSVSLSEVSRIVGSSATASDAVVALATTPGLELSPQHARALSAKLQSLVATNDKAGVTAVARELVLARQDRLHGQLLPIVADSCRAIGFAPSMLSAGNGLIQAAREGTRQRLAIEVSKSKDGGVQVHLDADGFEGGACVVTLDALQAELRARGVRCDLRERRRKQSRPAFDQSRIGQPLSVRAAR